MFIGHFALGILAAARKDAPSLPVLFVAAQLADWLFFGLLFAGVEKARMAPDLAKLFHVDLYYMPYSHSLVGTAVLALLFGTLIWLVTRMAATAFLSATVVFSHWFCDLLVHVPDVTIAGSPPKLGLGLWNYPAIEIPLELGITFGALWLYAKAKRPAFGPLFALASGLLLLQLFQWFGPIAPQVDASTSIMAYIAFGLLTLGAWWVDRNLASKQAG